MKKNQRGGTVFCFVGRCCNTREKKRRFPPFPPVDVALSRFGEIHPGWGWGWWMELITPQKRGEITPGKPIYKVIYRSPTSPFATSGFPLCSSIFVGGISFMVGPTVDASEIRRIIICLDVFTSPVVNR